MSMFALFVVLLFALGFAYFAAQNTIGVDLRVASYQWSNIPLFFIAFGSFLAGILLSWIISLGDTIATSITLFGKDNKIKRTENEVKSLKDKLHSLELENARLKGTSTAAREPLIRNPFRKPTLMERIRNNLT